MGLFDWCGSVFSRFLLGVSGRTDEWVGFLFGLTDRTITGFRGLLGVIDIGPGGDLAC